MKIYEFYYNKKSKQEEIIIHYPDKKHYELFKSLELSKHYLNTNTWTFKKSIYNENKLFQNGFKLYNEEMQIKNILINNNYLNIYYYNEMSKYNIMKKYTFTDNSECYVFGKFDAKKIKRIKFFKLEDYCIKVPVGFKNDFNHFEMIDNRKKRKWRFTDEEIKSCLSYLELYDIQIEAVKSCLNNVNGIIKAPTGSGKTEIFIAYLKLTNLKALILTTSIDLAKQTYDRMIKANLDVGIVQGTNIDEEHQIVIATVQSSHKLKNKYECVVVDECHEISNIHEKVLSDENIIYRFGFSATPLFRGKTNELKNMIIKHFLGDIIFEIKAETLQKLNKIATPYIKMIKIKNEKLYRLENERNWDIVEKLFITDNNERNKKVVELCKQIETQKMILCKKIKHGKIIEQMLLEENIKCIFLKGDNKKEERERVLKEYDLNKNDFILIGSKILFAGIDLQNIFNLFYVAGGKSIFEVIQSLGRALRSKTKLTVNIFDFYDCNNNVVESHSKKRIDLYRKEGFDNIEIIE